MEQPVAQFPLSSDPMGPSISQCYHGDELCLQTPPCGMRCDVTLEELLCSCAYALAHLLLLMTVIVCFPLHVSRHVNKETDRSLPLLTSACKRTACLIFGKSDRLAKKSCDSPFIS
jgi:hypothetical protein